MGDCITIINAIDCCTESINTFSYHSKYNRIGIVNELHLFAYIVIA